MEIIQSIILGIVQGITEFLPISSSGHLIAIPELFGWGEQGILFDVGVHIATLLAVVVALWKDVKSMALSILGKADASYKRLLILIIIGTIPVIVVGFTLRDFIVEVFRHPFWVVVSLVVWGLVLGIADSVSRKRQSTDMKQLSISNVLMIGIAQSIALIPGTSRSGITMSAGLFAGLSRKDAARFSFLLSIPAILGAGLLTFLNAPQGALQSLSIEFFVGCVVAFVSGLVAIKFLLNIVEKTSYWVFAVYRILLAIPLTLLLLT